MRHVGPYDFEQNKFTYFILEYVCCIFTFVQYLLYQFSFSEITASTNRLGRKTIKKKNIQLRRCQCRTERRATSQTAWI